MYEALLGGGGGPCTQTAWLIGIAIHNYNVHEIKIVV